MFLKFAVPCTLCMYHFSPEHKPQWLNFVTFSFSKFVLFLYSTYLKVLYFWLTLKIYTISDGAQLFLHWGNCTVQPGKCLPWKPFKLIDQFLTLTRLEMFHKYKLLQSFYLMDYLKLLSATFFLYVHNHIDFHVLEVIIHLLNIWENIEITGRLTKISIRKVFSTF